MLSIKAKINKIFEIPAHYFEEFCILIRNKILHINQKQVQISHHVSQSVLSGSLYFISSLLASEPTFASWPIAGRCFLLHRFQSWIGSDKEFKNELQTMLARFQFILWSEQYNFPRCKSINADRLFYVCKDVVKGWPYVCDVMAIPLTVCSLGTKGRPCGAPEYTLSEIHILNCSAKSAFQNQTIHEFILPF